MIVREFFAKHWPIYLLGIFFLIVTDLLALLIPWATGRAVDSIGLGNGEVGQSILLIGAVAIAMAILRYLYRECIMGTTRRLEHHLRNKIFHHSLFVPISVYDEAGPGKIMALTVNDVTSVRVAVGLGIMLLVDAGIMGLASFAVMFRSIDPMLAILAVAPLPFVFVGTAWLGRIVHIRFRKVQEQFGELTEFAQELFGGVKIVKAFGAESQFSKRFAAVNRENMAANLSLANIQAIYTWENRASLGGSIRYVGDSFDNAANTYVLQSYTLLDLRASYPVNETFELYGRVENAFDDDYETTRNYSSPGRGIYAGVRARF